ACPWWRCWASARCATCTSWATRLRRSTTRYIARELQSTLRRKSSRSDSDRLLHRCSRLCVAVAVGRRQSNPQAAIDEEADDPDAPIDDAHDQRTEDAAGHGRAEPLVQEAEAQLADARPTGKQRHGLNDEANGHEQEVLDQGRNPLGRIARVPKDADGEVEVEHEADVPDPGDQHRGDYGGLAAAVHPHGPPELRQRVSGLGKPA